MAEFLHVSCAAIAGWFTHFAYGSHEVKHIMFSLSGRGLDERAFLATREGVRARTWTVTTAQLTCGHPPPLCSPTGLPFWNYPNPFLTRVSLLQIGAAECVSIKLFCHHLRISMWWSRGSPMPCSASYAHLNLQWGHAIGNRCVWGDPLSPYRALLSWKGSLS